MQALKQKQEHERMVRKSEALEFLGVSLTTLNRLIEREEIPYYKLGPLKKKGVPVRFKLSDLVKYRESFRVQP